MGPLDALSHGLEIILTVDDKVHAILILPYPGEAAKTVFSMHKHLILRLSGKVQKLEEVFGILSIEE